MKRKFAAWSGALVVLGCGLGWMPAAWAATARVQYLSSTSVYLDAGRDAGLAEGTRVRVERDGQVIAELQVEFVAERSAACRVVTSTAPPRAGDTCVFEPAPPAPEGRPPPAQRPAPRPPSASAAPGAWPAASSLRGSVALQYRHSDESDGSISNPALRADARWDGTERRQVALRLRADRPSTHIDPALGATERPEELRLYEAELRYRGAGERLELAAGRLIPRGMEMVGYLDGGAAAYRPWTTVRAGALAGRGVQPASSGFTTGGYKLGGFVEASDARRGAGGRWRALAGAALLEDEDVTRRQFVLVRADQRLTPGLRLYENAEVDVNPGWRRALGDPKVDLTTLSLGTQFTPHRGVDLTFGYDSRRDQRAPETRFLEGPPLPLQRTHGGYGAVHVRLSKSTALRVGTDQRWRSDGTRVTRAWDGTLYGSHPSLRQLSGTLHLNLYDASAGKGEQYDLFLSWLAHSRLRFDASTGRQVAHDVATPDGGTADTHSDWLRLGTDLQLGRGLWLDATGEWRSGSASRDFFFEVGQRF